jgi:hypothetical protein
VQILSQPMLWTHDALLETASTRESQHNTIRPAASESCQLPADAFSISLIVISTHSYCQRAVGRSMQPRASGGWSGTIPASLRRNIESYSSPPRTSHPRRSKSSTNHHHYQAPKLSLAPQQRLLIEPTVRSCFADTLLCSLCSAAAAASAVVSLQCEGVADEARAVCVPAHWL